MVRSACALSLVAVLAGCTTERVIERPVPTPMPAMCLAECAEPDGVPTTNGELAEAWRARGETIACYKARLACVRSVTVQKHD